MKSRDEIKPRSIDDFEGNGVVIGCSHNHLFCTNQDSHPKDLFYSIDFKKEHKPDFIFDITKKLPSAYRNRFQLTMLESLDSSAFNICFGHTNGAQGFKNILSMTKENGFIFVVPSERQKEDRMCIKHMKYIELEVNAQSHCILIPKNQRLDIHQIYTELKKLDEGLLKIILNKTKLNLNDFRQKLKFFDTPFEMLREFPSYKIFEKIYLNSDETAQDDEVMIREFKDVSFRCENIPREDAETSHKNWSQTAFLGGMAVLVAGMGLFAYSKLKTDNEIINTFKLDC